LILGRKNFNPTLAIYPKTVFFIIVGMLFGLEYFIAERKKSGKWKVNFEKLLILGLPSFYISLSSLPYLNLYLWINVGVPWVDPYGIFADISKAILGYVILTSWYKST